MGTLGDLITVGVVVGVGYVFLKKGGVDVTDTITDLLGVPNVPTPIKDAGADLSNKELKQAGGGITLTISDTIAKGFANGYDLNKTEDVQKFVSTQDGLTASQKRDLERSIKSKLTTY